MEEINSAETPGNLSDANTTLMGSFKDFLKKNSRFYLIYGNVLFFMVIIYIFVVPVFISNFYSYYFTTISQIGYSIFFASMILIYPYFGMYKKEIHDPKKFILFMFIALTVVTILLDRLNIFMGRENFNFIWHYGQDYLNGVRSSAFTSEYYPFGSSLYFIFIYITNPGENPLIYRLMTNCWGMGIYYMVYKISTIKELGINRNKLANAFIYITISGIQLLFLLLAQKEDFFEVFLSLIGIYFTLKKRWFLSAFILVFCGFFKIYPFFWVAGMLILFLKQKDWRMFIKYAVNTIISGAILMSLEFIVEGDEILKILFSFRWQFLEEPAIYNLNWGYYLSYFNIPGLNLLPSILILCFFLVYAIKFTKKIDLNFFINSILIVLIFYSAVSYQYLIWVIPLIGLNFVNNKRQYRKATFIYDIIHVNALMLALSWFMLLGFQAQLALQSDLDPGKLLVVLVTQLILCIPLNVGFYLFIVLSNSAENRYGFLLRLKRLKNSGK
ncbi:MAG TPA: hypothetical protein VKM55_18575 [Candidatus Lokiarchaeia archaeon]|nr:hypothetical protein [Candidatus Lokiarchaeia archaeon]